MSSSESLEKSNHVQERVAKSVSIIVLTGTCLLGALGMSISILAMAKDRFEDAKDILQILFATILPLFGTWIGTVLAYYFSKENLAAANRTVEHLINNISSDKKLETIKAKDVMISVEKLIYKTYASDTDDSTLNLKTDFLDFIKANKISRVLLLNEKKAAIYVIHKTIIEAFIADHFFNLIENANKNSNNNQSVNSNETPKAPQTLTFADLKSKGNSEVQAVINDGAKFISENANLSEAKLLMKNFTSCNDVFITKRGISDEPILGWITNVTISENSIV